MALDVDVKLDAPGVSVGVVVVRGCDNAASGPVLLEAMDQAIQMAAASGDTEPDPRRAAVRDMLRHGRYKPTGRGKPASEYLVRAAVEGVFPRINVLADVNNLVSLQSRFPISVIDLDRAGANAFVVRFGREGESYVFNPSGQALELRDLLLAAVLPEDRPVATPVKDCQATKTDEGTRRALALLYGPAALGDQVSVATQRMAELIGLHGGGQVAWWCLSEASGE